tara:strand:- start:442 stop:789 length:348 start_codon:yes stop_codon:yes gene_type:complete
MTSTFIETDLETDLEIIWTHDRKSVNISDGKKKINFTKEKCFKIYRPEKDCEDIIKIDGSRFSGHMGEPSAIFFVPWREKEKRWSLYPPLREYNFKDMFNNTIKEVDNPEKFISE